MVWLLGGAEQHAAKDVVTETIAREWGARCDRDAEMAEDIVAGLYRAGYRVVREDTQLTTLLSADKARAALTTVLEGAVEDVLDWDTFKGATDEDIARRLVEFIMADETDYEVLIREKQE